MKRIYSILLLTFFTIQLGIAKDTITRDLKKLPDAAQLFIKKHFHNYKVSYIKIEKDFFKSTEYEVLLEKGVELKFDKKGEWSEIETKIGRVPNSLIPTFILQYLKENSYEEEFIVKIERDKKEYEVELNNDLTFTFNKNEELVDIDD